MRRLILSVMMTALAIAASGAIAQTSSGTAFAVAPELLVTNQHVVAGCSSIEVISANGRRKGSVVVADADIDLAILRVDGLKGSTARLRNPRAVRLGEPVMVFGYPLAGALSSGGNFTSGLVSALRGLRDAAGEIQITAPVQPGNSGGPVMDASGLVIGVVQGKLDAVRSARATGDIPQNVNFAISLEVLAYFLTKNKIAFHDAALSEPLDTARVADLAQNFTHRVECRGRSQQAGTSSDKEPRRLPQCPGSYAKTWSNCVGTLTYADGGKYVGEFKDGNPNGQGIGTMLNGAKYVGQYRNGMLTGRGTLTWPDGRKYVGEFTDNKPNGQGIQYRADGTILRLGLWENGVFVGSRSAAPARAEWVKVEEFVDVVIYIDPATISKIGHHRRVWEIQDLKQKGPNGEMSRRALWEHDCVERRNKGLAGSTHSGPMATGQVLFSTTAPGEWKYIAPDTASAHIHRIVCAR